MRSRPRSECLCGNIWLFFASESAFYSFYFGSKTDQDAMYTDLKWRYKFSPSRTKYNGREVVAVWKTRYTLSKIHDLGTDNVSLDSLLTLRRVAMPLRSCTPKEEIFFLSMPAYSTVPIGCSGGLFFGAE